jgi:hypothetical protein
VTHRARGDRSRGEWLVVTLLVALTVGINLPLLTRYPSPAADEASFVDAAVTLARHGALATPMHRDLLAGIEHHLYWQPPGYFVALAAWFRIVGIGLLQARTFSLICGVLIVIAVYSLSRRRAPPWTSAAGAALCAVSIWMMNGARLARMDSLCLVVTLACAITYERAHDARRPALFAACGLLAALALLCHPLGLVPIAVVSIHLLAHPARADVRRAPLFVMVGFVCGLLPWLAYILLDPHAFQLQMTAQLARKLALGSYWQQFWMAKTHIVSMFVVLASGFWLVLTRWRSTDRTIALGFLLSFAGASYGREMGYALYFYPWGCCAVAILLTQVQKWRALLFAILALAFVNDGAIIGHDVWRYRHRDYDALTRTVRTAIPPGASVFVGFPEVTPYFALVDRNPLRMAVPVPAFHPGAHLQAAESCDFIVESIGAQYIPELARLLEGRTPIAVVDQGPGYRLAIYKRP